MRQIAGLAARTPSRRRVLGLAGAAGLAGAGLAGLGYGRASAEIVRWPVVAPPERGLDPAALGALQARQARLGTRALLVARGGALVHEWYARSHRDAVRPPAAEPLATASMAKAAVGTTALLLLLGDGLVRLDDPAARHAPAWASHPVKSRITVAQLATHTSGLDDAPRPGATGADPREEWGRVFWRDPASRARLSIEAAPVRLAPGERVSYSNPGYEVLGYVLAAALRAGAREDLAALLRDRVMRPLAVPPSAWSISYGEAYAMDGLRLFEVGGGARFTPRALARLGQLYLRGGVWEGRPLLDPGALAAALRPADAPPPPGWRETRHPRPALGWWSNASGAWASAPRDTLVGAGAGHQLLVVVPSLDLVAARLGRPLGRDRWQGDYWIALEEELLAPLAAAVRG